MASIEHLFMGMPAVSLGVWKKLVRRAQGQLLSAPFEGNCQLSVLLQRREDQEPCDSPLFHFWKIEVLARGPADAGLRACTCRERKGERRDAQDRSLGTAFHLCIQTWWGDSEEPQLWTCALGCPGTAHLLPQGVQHGSLTLHTSRWQPGWAGCGPSEGTASVAVEPGS